MRTDGLIKNYVSGAAIGARRIVKPGATAGQVILAAAATDKLTGITTEVGTTASGQRIDVCHGGIADLVAGGNVAAGDLITSDDDGAGVVTTTAGNRIVGTALTAAVAGDIFPVLINVGSV